MIEMKVIGPKDWGSLIPVKAIEQAIVNSTQASAEAVKVDFEVTTETWKHKPTVTITAPSKFVRDIEVDDKIYKMVNDGTSAHDIFPHGRRLRFQTGYRPKTRPNGRIASYSGGKSGPFVFARKVRHPGFSGRHFGAIIRKKWLKQYPILMRRALNAAIRQRGR